LAAPTNETQCKLLFQKARDYARDFYNSIPEDQKFALAAATWHVCTSPENPERGADGKTIKPEPERTQNYKISNFVFHAFPEEITKQLDKLQFTELTATGISRESNELRDEVWKGGDTVNLEIRVRDDLSREDLRYNKRLFFIEDPQLGDYKEFGVVDKKGGQLPIGTKAKATIKADLVATANLHIDHPKIKQPIKFGKVNDCELAFHPFNGETYRVTLKQYQPPPVPVIKLDGKTIGELDSGSAEMLGTANRLQDGQALAVTLNTYGRAGGTHTLATTTQGNTIRANRQAMVGDFPDTRFNGEKATVTIGFKQPKSAIAVMVELDGEQKVAGLFTPNQRDSKAALVNAGLFKDGATFAAKITSNVTVASVKINPETVEYPGRGEWKKQHNATLNYESDRSTPQQQTADSLVAHLKKQPSILHKLNQDWEMPTGEIKSLPTLGLAVDRTVADATAKWLDDRGVPHTRLNPDRPGLEPETERGYAVFRMVEGDVPPQVRKAMEGQCGQALDANFSNVLEVSPYHQRLEKVPQLSPEKLGDIQQSIQEPDSTLTPKRQLPTLLSRESASMQGREFQQNLSPHDISPCQSVPVSGNPLAGLQPINPTVAARTVTATTAKGNTLTVIDINEHEWAQRPWRDEQAILTIGFQENPEPNQPPIPVAEVEGKILGALDSESIQKLSDRNLLNPDVAIAVSLHSNCHDRVARDIPTTQADAPPRETAIARPNWERNLVTLAFSSIEANPGNANAQTQVAPLGDAYAAVYTSQDKTLQILDVAGDRGCLYKASYGQSAQVNKFSEREKAAFEALGVSQKTVENSGIERD
jgi:hypothetical protein